MSQSMVFYDMTLKQGDGTEDIFSPLLKAVLCGKSRPAQKSTRFFSLSLCLSARDSGG